MENSKTNESSFTESQNSMYHRDIEAIGNAISRTLYDN